MQFQLNHKIGTSHKTVVLDQNFSKLRVKAIERLTQTFEKLGGYATTDIYNWQFPAFVTSETISEIIKNTCYVCGGLMTDSTAIKNDDLIHKNSGNDIIWKNAGSPRMLRVRKCSSCGHSHT